MGASHPSPTVQPPIASEGSGQALTQPYAASGAAIEFMGIPQLTCRFRL